MELNTLKIIAGSVVVESKLSKPAKLQMITWLEEEATEAQLKAFLLDGSIAQLDEQAEQIVNDRFETHRLNEGGWKTIGGMLLTNPIYWAAYRAIRAAFDAKSKKCGVFGIGRKRDVCLWKLKAEQARKEAAIFKKGLSDCAKHPNPNQCKAKGLAAVQKALGKAKKFEDKIKTYSFKDPNKALKAKAGLEKAASKKETNWT